MDKWEQRDVKRAIATLKRSGYSYDEALRLTYNQILKLQWMGPRTARILFGEPTMAADPNRVAEVKAFLDATRKESS